MRTECSIPFFPAMFAVFVVGVVALFIADSFTNTPANMLRGNQVGICVVGIPTEPWEPVDSPEVIASSR